MGGEVTLHFREKADQRPEFGAGKHRSDVDG